MITGQTPAATAGTLSFKDSRSPQPEPIPYWCLWHCFFVDLEKACCGGPRSISSWKLLQGTLQDV